MLLKEFISLARGRGLLVFFFRILQRFLKPAAYETIALKTWLRPLKKNSTELPVLKMPDRAEHVFFARRFPHADWAAIAARVIRREFDFLGTDPTVWQKDFSWYRDPASGHQWPQLFYGAYGRTLTPGAAVDIKIPWELVRFQHAVPLAQAACLSDEDTYSEAFVAAWRDWRQHNPWGYGIHWTCAMEVAIRAVNCILGLALLGKGLSAADRADFNRSLRQHGRFIEYNLEIGVVGGKIEVNNHFLADVCGLACIGLACPHLPEAGRWREMGIRGLEREMERQVLGDGFSFESSTSYHRLALEFFLAPLLLVASAKSSFSPIYWQRLEKMVEAIIHLIAPDGTVPQVGDNDDGRLFILADYGRWPRHDYRYLLGIAAVLFERGDFKEAAAACPHEVFWFFGRQGVEAFDRIKTKKEKEANSALPDAGLYVIRSGDGQDYALIRAGRASAGATGHFHNDVLAVELWSQGRCLLVDPGTAAYTSDPQRRNLLRSTRMHNTVMVDGAEINEIPADLFRMGRHAAVRVSHWRTSGETAEFAAEHDGYKRLDKAVGHRRCVQYLADTRAWKVRDDLAGDGEHTAEWNWYFARDDGIDVTADGNALQVVGDGFSMVMELGPFRSLDYECQKSERALAYGVLAPCLHLRVSVGWSREICGMTQLRVE
jgi:hypothetical protein